MLQKSLQTDYDVAKSAMPGIIMEAYAADLIFYMGDGPAAEGLPEHPVIKRSPKNGSIGDQGLG